MLRITASYLPDPGQENANKQFSANNKESHLKDLRMMWIELKRQDDFLVVAKDHNYDIAEKMKEIEGNGQLSESRKKILSDILRDSKKSNTKSVYSPRKFSPYDFPPNFKGP